MSANGDTVTELALPCEYSDGCECFAEPGERVCAFHAELSEWTNRDDGVVSYGVIPQGRFRRGRLRWDGFSLITTGSVYLTQPTIQASIGGRWVRSLSTGGIPFSVWEPEVTRTRDDFVDCVVYLYESVEDAECDSPHGGTGFLVGVEPEGPEPRSHADMHIYAVTARHVIDGGATVIRLNTRAGGTDTLPFTAGKWKPHPDGHDLAVAALSLEERPRHFGYGYFRAATFLDLHTMQSADIGIGDDVFMVGRFAPHQGKQQNAPVVRYGNISRMPGEPVPTENGEVQDGLLVEMRSLSGFSGSPVFWHRDPKQLLPRDKGPESERRMRLVLPDFEWLLGVDVSHFPIWRTVQRKDGDNLTPMSGMVVDLNSGQAVVIPVSV